MAITREFVGAGNVKDVPSTTSTFISWSHTSSGGSDCIVLIGFCMTPDVTSSSHNRNGWTATVTYGSSDAMFVGACNKGVADNIGAVYWFAVQDPPTGTQTVQVNMTLPSGMGQILHGNSVSYTGVRGVHQVNVASGSSSTGTITVASVSGRKLVHVGGNSGGPISAYNQNLLYNDTLNQTVVIGDADGASSVTFSWNLASTRSYGSCVLELIPVDEPQRAVTIRSIGEGGRTAGTSTTLATSWTHRYDNNFASYPVAFAVVAVSVGASTGITCSATYGGQAMTQFALFQAGSASNRNAVGFYYLTFPPTGSSTVTVTTGGDGTKYSVIGESVIYENVQTIGDIGNVASLSTNISGTVPGIRILSVTTNGSALSSSNQYDLYHNGASVTGVGDYAVIQEAVGNGGIVNFSVSGTASTPNSYFIQINPNLYNRDFMQMLSQ